MISGDFQLSFPTQAAMKIAAIDCRARAFAVRLSEQPGGWQLIVRRRDPFPESECERYAGRLRVIAEQNDGTYDWFRPDDPPAGDARPA